MMIWSGSTSLAKFAKASFSQARPSRAPTRETAPDMAFHEVRVSQVAGSLHRAANTALQRTSATNWALALRLHTAFSVHPSLPT